MLFCPEAGGRTGTSCHSLRAACCSGITNPAVLCCPGLLISSLFYKGENDTRVTFVLCKADRFRETSYLKLLLGWSCPPLSLEIMQTFSCMVGVNTQCSGRLRSCLCHTAYFFFFSFLSRKCRSLCIKIGADTKPLKKHG